MGTSAVEYSAVFPSTASWPNGIYRVRVEVIDESDSTTLYTNQNVTTFSSAAPIRVVAGSTRTYVDSAGNSWAPDQGFSGGYTEDPDVVTYPITGTADPFLYRGLRWGQDPTTGATAPFTYTFTVPAPGKYAVTLKWNEHYVTGPNQRYFGVNINGQSVIENTFDLFAAAGGMFIPYDRTFTITATGTEVVIEFVPGAIENPKIDAIEVKGAP